MRTKELKTVEYQGKLVTLNELSAMHGVPVTCINNRLRNGWDIEVAIREPVSPTKQLKPLPEMFADGKVVEVVFTSHIPGVFSHMQPRLMKKYRLIALQSMCKDPIFTITLENGKPLIVYPEEFEIVYAEAWSADKEIAYA